MSRPAPVPDGYTTVTPWIIVRGADRFLEFLKEVLGAEELGRVYDERGAIGADPRYAEAMRYLRRPSARRCGNAAPKGRPVDPGRCPP